MGAFEYPAEMTLSVTISGSGSGTVNSVTQGQTFACETGECSKSVPLGTVFELTATLSATSLFDGWSGACTNKTGNCNLTMNADRSVTASFIVMPPLRIFGSDTAYYQTFTEAYGSTQDGSTTEIQAQGVVLDDSAVDLSRNVHVTMKGGYGPGFSGITGDTTLAGALTVSLGSLTVERLIVR
jgi:hypothetical protein